MGGGGPRRLARSYPRLRGTVTAPSTLSGVLRTPPLAALALALAVIALAAPPAGARTQVAIGSQTATMFSNPLFTRLKIRAVRYTVAWDLMFRRGSRLRATDAYLRRAKAAGAEVLVVFNKSAQNPWHPPTPRTYRDAVSRFIKRYRWVREYVPWNEPNHFTQPLWFQPALAAAYFNELRRACRGCLVLAGGLVDSGKAKRGRGRQPWPASNIRSFLKVYTKNLHSRPRAWAFQNYYDANTFGSTLTGLFLQLTRGPVWLTETGGSLRRTDGWPRYNQAHQARAVDWVLRLADRTPRLRRVYIYDWSPGSVSNGWDSAITDPDGKPRPAYEVLARRVGLSLTTPPRRTPLPGLGR